MKNNFHGVVDKRCYIHHMLLAYCVTSYASVKQVSSAFMRLLESRKYAFSPANTHLHNLPLHKQRRKKEGGIVNKVVVKEDEEESRKYAATPAYEYAVI
jgi:hypothetical protein